MGEDTCDCLFDKQFSQGRNYGDLFDRKTRARLEREDRETRRGLLALKRREKIRERKVLEQRQGERQGNGKETGRDEEGQKEIKRDYRFTEWSKVKIRRIKREEEKWKEYLLQREKKLFFARLTKLKTNLLHLEWNRTCHLKERIIIRRNIRLQNILRIRWKYKIDETLSSDNQIFDKLINHERKRKKLLILRRERTVRIIEKLTREMKKETRLPKKPKDSHPKIIESDETFGEISFEGTSSTSSTLAKETLKEPPIMKEKIIETEKGIDVKKCIKLRESQSSTEQIFPKDNCFFATPNIVIFENFKANKVYSRKIIITNKTAKWAYIRFQKIYTEVWEPGVVEIDIMDAAKVKPGLHVPVYVKFSPVHVEEVRAEISFLTLNLDDTKTFHQFRVPVHCTPEGPLPFLEPKEVRFISAPIWKYNHPKFNEKILTITNEGEISFSMVLEERNPRENCFLWHFDQAELQSEKSFTLCINESKSEEINGEIRDNISNEGRSRKIYQIEVPPKLKCNLRITFRPKYIGLHHEVFDISFVSNNRIFGEQAVPIWAEVTGYQIHLDPLCIDLGIMMIDSDVCQRTFNIFNTGRTIVNVSMKTPKCLGGQVSVRPNTALVQPETFSKVSVRLMPESSINLVSKRFYDPLSNILEFPIQVHIVSKDEEKPPPLILKVLASLTTCHGLILEPLHVDLGQVYTHESVYAKLTMTNESLLTQEYAFMNLPPTMEIQPNDGFGSILPGETIKLHLIYSPILQDIPGNEIGANGIAGERTFLIKIVTLAELAGSKNPSTIDDNLRIQMSVQTKIPKKSGLPPLVPMELKKSKKIIERRRDKDNLDILSNQGDNDSMMSQEHKSDEEELGDATIEKFHHRDERKKNNTIRIHVYIKDTFCELSEQIIQFPATPCGSYSMASVNLRGFNMATYPNCTCGVIKNQTREFTARYELKSSSDKLNIAPARGTLNSNEFMEVKFMFKPRLPKKMIFEEGLKLKMNVEEQETKSDRGGRKGGTKKGPKKEARDKKDTSEVERFACENNLLETFEPCVSTIFVTCEIEVETRNGKRFNEELFAKLICPITRPEIVVLNENRRISFEPSAIGTSSRQFLLIKNISNETAKVEVSLLDPFGPFFVPPGKTIETGSILKLPVTYRATQDQREDRECLEVFSSKTRTRWGVKLSGRGVVPSYVLKPRFRVARFRVTDEKPVQLTMTLQNTGQCPLIFRLCITEVLEGEIQGTKEESTRKDKQDKKKKKSKTEADGTPKSPIKMDFDDSLRPNEQLAIFGGYLKRISNHGCFSFLNVDENMQLLVPEKRKVDFGVQFQLRVEESGSDSRRTTEESTKRKKGSKRVNNSTQSKNSNFCHVAMVKLILGSITVQDFVIICSII